MSKTNTKGDIAESAFINECIKNSLKVSIPYGHDTSYDLIVDKDNKLFRIQVKYADNDGIKIKARTVSNERKYTSDMIDYLVVFDPRENKFYYVPSTEFADGRKSITLSLNGVKNKHGISPMMAKKFESW
jgi:hypothetical protein